MATRKAAAAPAETATATTEFTFADAPVPVQTRKSTAVNPLLPACIALRDTMGDSDKSTTAKAITVADAEQAKRVKRWLAEAGRELGVTFRSIVDDEKDGTRITFWSVTRISKPRKA